MDSLAVLALATWLAALLADCSSISTPLPPSKPIGSTAMSAEDTQKAIRELNEKRESQRQAAEQEIDRSR